MSKPQEREQLEQLLFNFKMQIATEDDFRFFYSLLSKQNLKNKQYFTKIKKFFNENYEIKLHENISEKCGQQSDLLPKFDEIFILQLNPTKLLKYLNEDNLSKKFKSKKLSIRNNIKSLFDKDKCKEDIPLELLFYLQIFSCLQHDEIPQQLILKLLNLFKDNTQSQNFVNLPEKVKLQPLNSVLINNAFWSVQNKETSNKFVYYYKIVEIFKQKIENEALSGKIYELQCLFKQIDPKNFGESQSIKTILDYCNILSLADKANCFEIFNTFFLDNQIKYSKENIIYLLEWLSSNIEKNPKQLEYFDKQMLTGIKQQLDNLTDKQDLFSHKIPELLIKLIEKNDNNYLGLKHFYSFIKHKFNDILAHNIYPIQFRFTTYYFNLIYKQLITETVARIGLNKEKPIVDVQCIFLFLHPELFSQIKGTELFKTILPKLEGKNLSEQRTNNDYNKTSVN